MSETRLRKYVLDNIEHVGHWSKVESHDTSAGIPDLNHCISGAEGWLELKFGNEVKPPKLRPTQCAWFRRRTKMGIDGAPQLLVCVELDGHKTFGLVRGRSVPKLIHAKTNKQWLDACYVKWENRIHWGEFLTHILDPL